MFYEMILEHQRIKIFACNKDGQYDRRSRFRGCKSRDRSCWWMECELKATILFAIRGKTSFTLRFKLETWNFCHHAGSLVIRLLGKEIHGGLKTAKTGKTIHCQESVRWVGRKKRGEIWRKRWMAQLKYLKCRRTTWTVKMMSPSLLWAWTTINWFAELTPIFFCFNGWANYFLLEH